MYPVERTLGLEAGYTERLTRIITRCVGLWSYRLYAETIEELCGVRLSHTTLGKIADATSVKLASKLEDNPDLRDAFQKATGEIEFYADGALRYIRLVPQPRNLPAINPKSLCFLGKWAFHHSIFGRVFEDAGVVEQV
jgi:hypothetical protein